MKISSKLINIFKQNDSFLIVGHIHPEGDSLGSSLALALGLKKLGKKDVCVLSIDEVPYTLKFLPLSKTVKQKMPRKKYDVMILVDCNTPARTGFSGFNTDKTVIVDHHVLTDEEKESDFHRSLTASYIDTGAAAAGICVYRILKALKVTIDKDIATNLYTSILVDTGGFRYSNTSTESLKIAAEMVEAGAKPWDISKEIYENLPYNAMKLLGLSLSTLEKKDGVAWITARKSNFTKTGTSAVDADDFVNYPRKVSDVDVAVFFRQDKEKTYKVSLRSKGKVNVQKIAKSFGGGGHVAAAGCSIDGSLKEVQAKVFRAIKKSNRGK